MSEQNSFEVIQLNSDTPAARVEQFVAMMGRMYDFHATLHDDWQTRTNWQQGSQNWLKNAGRNDDYFFGLACPLTSAGTIDETTAAGYVIASFHYEAPLFLQNRFGYIADLWVEEAFRKRGVAHKLLTTTYTWFREQGVQRVQLEVDVENLAGQKFWHNNGFSDFEIVMRSDI